ncbi:MAG: zf-HC2 domain-containing protein [Chitinivibrionales bacterium]
MKTCASFGLMISRYIDNDLDHEESCLLQRHIGVCDTCRTTLDNYVKMKKLVCTSFLPARNFAFTVRAGRPSTSALLRQRWDLKLAALLAVAITLVAGFSARILNVPETQDHAMITISSSSVMNAPLGSLVYYQDFAGNDVHSQFVNMSSSPVTDVDQETDAWDQNASYESPLFRDNLTSDENAAQ